jgi:hypothetical protein
MYIRQSQLISDFLSEPVRTRTTSGWATNESRKSSLSSARCSLNKKPPPVETGGGTAAPTVVPSSVPSRLAVQKSPSPRKTGPPAPSGQRDCQPPAGNQTFPSQKLTTAGTPQNKTRNKPPIWYRFTCFMIFSLSANCWRSQPTRVRLLRPMPLHKKRSTDSSMSQ